MRPYHSSNQDKHFNKSNIMYDNNERAAPLLSTAEKKYLAFHDTNSYKNDYFHWNTYF